MRKIAQVLGSKRLTADIIMSKEVATRLNRRFSFDFLIPKDAEYRDELFGIGARVVALGDPSNISLSQIGAFARYFRANPADVVHTHASLSARVGARLVGIDKCLSTRSVSSLAPSLRKWSVPIYNRFTMATLCHSPCIFDELLDEGIARDRIIAYYPTSPSGDPTVSYCEDRSSLCERTLICPLPLYEGFGQSTVIRALARLPKTPLVRLVFCGSGPKAQEYRLLAERLGVGERVEFCADIMTTIIYNIETPIVVLSHEERWEIPQMIFLDLRLPIIASDIPENKALFGSGCEFFDRGNVFSLERAISRICDGSIVRHPTELQKNRAHSIDALCDFYERVYCSL